MATGDDVLVALRSIDANLKTLLAIAQATVPKPVASDRDLDGKYGDEQVRFDPRDWTGDSFKGRLMSECPVEFLELMAETFDYFAGQAEAQGDMYKGKPTAPYKKLSAARARGWAKRLRSRWAPPSIQAPVNTAESAPDPFGVEPEITDQDIPFAWLAPFILPIIAAGSVLC